MRDRIARALTNDRRGSNAMPTIAARIPRHLLDRLQSLADEAGVKLSSAIRAALRAALDEDGE